MMAKTLKNKITLDAEESGKSIHPGDRDHRMAKLAYIKAKSRGFELCHELDDELEAEQELLLKAVKLNIRQYPVR